MKKYNYLFIIALNNYEVIHIEANTLVQFFRSLFKLGITVDDIFGVDVRKIED